MIILKKYWKTMKWWRKWFLFYEQYKISLHSNNRPNVLPAKLLSKRDWDRFFLDYFCNFQIKSLKSMKSLEFEIPKKFKTTLNKEDNEVVDCRNRWSIKTGRKEN